MPADDDWRRYGAGYQVYPRSFADSNGDGMGDINGITNHLDYVESLSVDLVWISPWYPSPFRDGGYDVADYCDIDPAFGTLEDAAALFARAGASGLRVVLDLVINHTSNEHPWFRAAAESDRGSAERGRYHVLPGIGANSESPPNDWRSTFGGSAWSPLGDGDWYLHLFDASQPDLNWANTEVRAAIAEVMRFWVDRGVSGFRVDSAQHLAKDPTYPNWRGRRGDHVIPPGTERPYSARPELHDLVRGLRTVLDGCGDRELLLVAENIVSPWQRQADFIRPGEFDQVFNFEYLETPWDRDLLGDKIVESLDAAGTVGALPTWTLSNHDFVRPATRFGLPQGIDIQAWLLNGDRDLLNVELGQRRARAAAMLAMALPGSYYLFQGEELGLPEAADLPLDALDDPIFVRSDGAEKGRDGCRVPIPWTPEGPSFGFGSGGSWLPQPSSWGRYAVSAQSGRDGSTLELFRRCLRLRSQHFAHDDFEWTEVNGAISFRRRNIACITNFGERPIELPRGHLLASSEALTSDGSLRTDCTAWVSLTN